MQRFVIGVLVALAVVCGSLPTSTRAAEVSRFQYSGPTAEAVFTGVEGCIRVLLQSHNQSRIATNVNIAR